VSASQVAGSSFTTIGAGAAVAWLCTLVGRAPVAGG
jgi:hypothetical protein